MAVQRDDALVGRVLDDRYVIGERIARGGMASVFRAMDERLDREVAVKVMHHALGDDQQFTDRFVREAKSAAKLNHRNVVSVFDQGKDGDVAYLVMEYVPGRTLRDLMRAEAPMPPLRALGLIEQVLIALSAAHAAKIIHRDVKPENVLITPDGDVKVADFGLARAVSAATTATGGTLIGTVSYLAPEIVLHEGADARSDVYAAGAMLYEMLTGVKPHVGDSPIQVAYKHVHEDIGPPSAIVATIPAFLDALVARSTVRDRDQRSTDARVLLQQVRSVRRALEAGVTEDADLTADLLPRVGMPTERSGATDESGEVSDDTVAVAVAAGAAASSAATETVHTGRHGTEVRDSPEHTVQWSGEPVPPIAATSAGLNPTGLHPPISPESYREMRANQPPARRGRRLLIGALVAALLAGVLGWYVADGRYTQTPVLVGSQETEAKSDAVKAGFTFKVGERRFSETVPAGVVIATDPGPGDKILPDSTINAVVSKGKDRVVLPEDIKGLTVKALTAKLEAVDLVIGDTTDKFDEKVKKDRVIGPISIKADQQLKRGTQVDVYVSKGREPIPISDYTGKPIEDGRAAAEKADLKSVVQEQFSDDIDKGIIISQKPDSGTLFKGDTITFVVSKGPDVVKVPEVVGRKKKDAVKILEKAGFEVRAYGPNNFTVKRQSPDGGKKAKRGSTVNISFF
ncbi:MAG: Stk1 family PASTA domain-containing Ser/Thr kinase [Aeromicrobium sp.]|uniref:Stk1 family PASTA domain-containing Ser/Thr kinase n=1 Tax=Aeromicrobium sp. TaxID=1871063 RepID=UPI003C63499B